MTKEVRNRKCLVTGEVYPAYELVRFVCAPDGQIVPDVAAKLPGRGCWINAKREHLQTAVNKKILTRFGYQVLSNLSKKKTDIDELDEVKCENEKRAVIVNIDLVDQIEKLLEKRCLDYLGLANRAGNILSGFEKVRSALKHGKTSVLVTASDGAENGRIKMCQGIDKLRIIDIFTRDKLSKAVGLENAVHLALLPGGIAVSLMREISRYELCRKTVIK